MLTLALAAASSADRQRHRLQQFHHPRQLHLSHRKAGFLPNEPTLLMDGLTKTTFDGEGNLTELDAVAANGNVAPGWVSNTGKAKLDDGIASGFRNYSLRLFSWCCPARDQR
jgi:hypothetical protein